MMDRGNLPSWSTRISLQCVLGSLFSVFSRGRLNRIRLPWKLWRSASRDTHGTKRDLQVTTPSLGLHSIQEYRPLVGEQTVDRIAAKAAKLSDLHIANVSSTQYGGGVAEILSPLTLLMNAMGIEMGWRVIEGRPEFFAFTKELHNGLQGGPVEITENKVRAYEQILFENSLRLHLEHDVVIVHDPQPLALVQHYHQRAGPWIWCCHVDLSTPAPEVWRYLKPYMERYNTVVFSLPDYARDLRVPQQFIMPAINPFSTINKDLTETEIEDVLARHRIPTDLPLVVQVSRFDKWKDPQGVIAACEIARQTVDCTLVLVGSTADDDPEAAAVLQSVQDLAGERTLILSITDALLVNALQRRATVILQKSIREGFGLTVAEAMWKGTPVIGGNVGGIRHQITDGKNGFLVNTVGEAAARILELLQSPKLRERMGAEGRESVRRQFLLSRLVEDWLDLIASLRAMRE
jgi:trehalose synthase